MQATRATVVLLLLVSAALVAIGTASTANGTMNTAQANP